jgi:hypothetical protein
MLRYLVLAIGITMLLSPSALQGQSEAPEQTDVYIRRLAGLPAESARGQIEIVDVGHHPLDTMLSIVGNRTEAGWTISYACAMSSSCAPGADHLAMVYTLSASKSADVDRLIARLRVGGKADGAPVSANRFRGYFQVRVDVPGFKRTYDRRINLEENLSQLETLLLPTLP